MYSAFSWNICRMRLCRQIGLVADLQIGLSCPWDCHVYGIRAPGGIVLIDAGSGMATDALLHNLREDLGTAEITAVVLTHAHPDHACGVAPLLDRYGCQVWAPAPCREVLEQGDEDRSGLAKARRRGAYPMEMRMRPSLVHHSIEHGEIFEVAGLRFEALHVSGHSPDSFCYLTELECGRSLFVGDVLFYGGVLGLINAEGSSLDGYRSHLERLKGLGVDCLFPGHGLFTFRNGQLHIDTAIRELERGFVPRMIGQHDLIF